MAVGPTLLISEVLEKVAKAKTKEQKINTLREHDSPALRMILKGSFDPNIEWLLPEGEVPFKRNDAPAGMDHSTLFQMSKKLFHYVKGGNDPLNQNRRETMFIQLLEGLHESEADVLIWTKDKALHRQYKGLSDNVVRSAFNWDENYNKVTYPEDKTRSATGVKYARR